METIEQLQRHDFRYQITPCTVTGERTLCLSVMLGEVEVTADDGTSEVGQIWGNFSQEGLAIMQRALAAAPPPMDLPDPDGIRANLKYYWVAAYYDGSVVRQWPDDKHLGHVDVHRVRWFYLLPKDDAANAPRYCLDRQRGLLRAAGHGMDFVPMLDPEGNRLPFPEVPFHLEYCFRPQITLACGGGHHEVFPVHVRHELGWRVDQCHGDDCDTWFIIAIEDDDGSWQVLKKEPLESRHFQQRERRVIEGRVKIVDAWG